MLIILFATFITNVNAAEISSDSSTDLNEVVAQKTKYYKTVTALNNSSLMRSADLGEVTSFTTEVSEEEYNNSPIDSGISPQATTVETSYKKLTVKMKKYNVNYFEYDATLTWKQMPSTRSYDIMAIGYYGSVKIVGEVNFTQTYCTTSGVCSSAGSYYSKKGNNGAGAMFHLPSSDLTSLKQNIHFLVGKTYSTDTLYEQICVGDYSHATKAISYNLAKEFFVDTGGIKLDENYYYYDEIPEAEITWKGTW